jgi:tRNA pseudouridine(38-40) synthase
MTTSSGDATVVQESIGDDNHGRLQDTHVHVLLSLEYHGTKYGGWQRQGPNNRVRFPSVQGTLEQAATRACHSIIICAKEQLLISNNEAGEFVATLSGSSGRTDRGVHALDHQCLLRLPFPQGRLHDKSLPSLTEFLLGDSPATSNPTEDSPFLTSLNEALPSDIHIRTCVIMTKQQRKQMNFYRKRYTYLIQQAPRPSGQSITTDNGDDTTANNNDNHQLNRPWPHWNDYTYFVKEPLDALKMQQALRYMVGKHDFLPLSCKNSKSNTVRTLYEGTITAMMQQDQELPWFHRAFRTPEARRRRKRKKMSDFGGNALSTGSSVNHSVILVPTDASLTQNHVSSTATTAALPDATPCSIHPSISIFGPPHYGAPLHDNVDDEKRPTIKENHDRLQPRDYAILKIELEGNGFLRHQVRRMVSLLIKVGSGVWPPEIVPKLLAGKEDPKLMHGIALAPSRALWKTKVWTHYPGNTTGGDTVVNLEVDAEIDDDDE